MLKRYYSLNEAAEFLSGESGQPISSADVMELAARGEISLYIWAEGILGIFKDEGAGDRLVRLIHSFRGYINIPSFIISPTAQSCQFRHISLAYDIRGELRGKIPFVIPPEFIGIIESRGDPDDMGALGLEYAVFGPHKPREFAPSIDEMVVPTSDLLRLTPQPVDAKADKPHGNTEGNNGKRLECLGAALALLAHSPEDCKSGNKITGAAISRALHKPEIAARFWPETKTPPISSKLDELINQWLGKLKDPSKF